MRSMRALLLTLTVPLLLVFCACGKDRTPANPFTQVAASLAGKTDGYTWPQWQGPDRTNISKETGLLKEWKEMPKLLWTNDNAGVGYSGPAVVGDRLYMMGSRDGTEMIFALDVQSGKEVWATEIGKVFVNNWGDGPRGTPTVDGGLVYGVGGQGILICVEAGSGKKVWSKDMPKEMGAKVMSGWGFCESPLVDGDRLIVTPGGRKGTFAALDKKTGEVIWQSKELTDSTAYSSIIIAEIDGVKQYVNMTGEGVAAVDAKDGKLLWKSEEGKNRVAIIPTPIHKGEFVYVTSGYGRGCGLLKLKRSGDKFEPEVVYSNKVMGNHHGGVVLVDGYLYGHSDTKGGWVCQEFKGGEMVWRSTKLGKGSLTCAEGKLYCYSEREGTLVLVDVSSKGWTEHGRFTIPKTTSQPRKSGQIWTHPVVCDGKLYLRDQDLLFCFDIRAER